MRGQPWSKPDARALKWAKRLTMVSMFGYACLMAGALLGMSGCAATGQDTVTSPPAHTPSTSDMGRYDESIAAMCEGQALTVALELVSQALSILSVEDVTEIVGYLYSNCLRDNGRGA